MGVQNEHYQSLKLEYIQYKFCVLCGSVEKGGPLEPSLRLEKGWFSVYLMTLTLMNTLIFWTMVQLTKKNYGA